MDDPIAAYARVAAIPAALALDPYPRAPGVEPGYIERRNSNGRVTRSKIKVSKGKNRIRIERQ